MKRASAGAAIAALAIVAAVASLPRAWSQTAPSPGTAALDYKFFMDKVQPVFLAKREGHTRCVVCHTFNNAAFHLVSLTRGSDTWDETQSRQNFELIKRVAMPGYMESKLLIHPLAEEAGGDPHHGGGQQFSSKDDPAWQTLKAFVMGDGTK